jgi:hypothetical protein
MTTVAEIVIAADATAWRRVGLPVDSTGRAMVGSVCIQIVPPGSVEAPGGSASGATSWLLASAPSPVTSIDGLATRHLAADVDLPTAGSDAVIAPGALALDVAGFDHLVINTDDLERTCHAIEAATGAPLKRVREVGALRQGFHRLGEVVLEVVTHPQVPTGPASFWGFVINVSNLDEVAARLGPDVISPAKDAVQPGRRIATFRVEAGLGLPVALMTPLI